MHGRLDILRWFRACALENGTYPSTRALLFGAVWQAVRDLPGLSPLTMYLRPTSYEQRDIHAPLKSFGSPAGRRNANLPAELLDVSALFPLEATLNIAHSHAEPYRP